jgi:hypothetical protein
MLLTYGLAFLTMLKHLLQWHRSFFINQIKNEATPFLLSNIKRSYFSILKIEQAFHSICLLQPNATKLLSLFFSFPSRSVPPARLVFCAQAAGIGRTTICGVHESTRLSLGEVQNWSRGCVCESASRGRAAVAACWG